MAEEKLKKLEEKLREELKCSICLETFSNPRLLECYHAYCQDCLDKLMKKSKQQITCPSCRQDSAIPASGVDGLPTALHLSGLVDTAKLFDTDVSYCSESEHSTKEAELFCKTCEELICWRCVIKAGRHHSHDYFELTSTACEEYLKDTRIKLLEELKRVDSVMDDIQKGITKAIGKCSNQRAHLLRELKKSNANNQTWLLQKKRVSELLKCLKSQKKQADKLLKSAARCHSLAMGSDEPMSPREQVVALKKAKCILNRLESETSEISQEIEEVLDKLIANPLKCSATGAGLETAVVNKLSTFTIRTSGSAGRTCISAVVKCEIVDKYDSTLTYTLNEIHLGSYEVTYAPSVPGWHKIKITVDGREISGSPFNVMVSLPYYELYRQREIEHLIKHWQISQQADIYPRHTTGSCINVIGILVVIVILCIVVFACLQL